jgi:hypothetical protein
VPSYIIARTIDGQTFQGLYECKDFHAASESGLHIANEEGSRLSAIGLCEGIPTTDGTPKIGIFWRLQSSDDGVFLLMDCVAMAKAETYGEFLTYGAHYEHWNKLAAMGQLALLDLGIPDVVRWTEYEEWPRGRVVFHRPDNRFILYADPTLQTPPIIAEIVHRFSLPADRTDVRSDAHYVLTHRR